MKKLDEKGFVFLDDGSRPYHVRIWSELPWLFWWHPNNKWVSLRTLTQAEVWTFAAQRLPDEQAALYFPRTLEKEEVKP